MNTVRRRNVAARTYTGRKSPAALLKRKPPQFIIAATQTPYAHSRFALRRKAAIIGWPSPNKRARCWCQLMLRANTYGTSMPSSAAWFVQLHWMFVANRQRVRRRSSISTTSRGSRFFVCCAGLTVTGKHQSSPKNQIRQLLYGIISRVYFKLRLAVASSSAI